MRVAVFSIHEIEFVLNIKRNSIQICINRQESTSRLIFDDKHRLDVIYYSRTNLPTFCRIVNPKSA